MPIHGGDAILNWRRDLEVLAAKMADELELSDRCCAIGLWNGTKVPKDLL